MKKQLTKILMIACLLFAPFYAAFAQTSVSGIVSDDIGALPGVNVMIEGSLTGTVTNDKGEYTISVEEGKTLVFSYLGFSDKKIVVGKNHKIDVTMTEDAQQLEALVVVGYGVQRRKDITGSVASVKMDDMKYNPGSDAMSMLRGRVAGIEVTSGSGRPGSNANIKIRGSRSLTGGNDPLFVIDGSPATEGEFGMLNPNDIASIEVLKDAASQTVYGTRAANGVILVTTKRGEANRIKVSINSYGSVQTLWRNFDYYSGEEYYQLAKEALAGGFEYMTKEEYDTLTPDLVLNDAIKEEKYAAGEFIDWEKLTFRPAWSHKHDISVSGGNEKIRIAASLGYFDKYGMVKKGSRYQRINGRFNLDFKIAKWLSMGVNASYAIGKSKREASSFEDFIKMPPLGQVYNEDGSYSKYIDSNKDQNPLYKQEQYQRRIDKDTYRLNTFFDVKPFKGFNYRLNMSYYNSFSEDGNYTSSKAIGSTGAGGLENRKYQNFLIENIFTYLVPIQNMNHRLNLTLMQSYDYTLSKGMSYAANNVPVDMDWNMLPKGELTDFGRSYSEETMISFMARAQYSIKDRYLFTASVRVDGDSKFGPKNKWAVFPSVSGAWLMSEEPWLKGTKVDELKLRVSWGQVGSHGALSRYKSLGLANSYDMEFDQTHITGFLPGSELSNPNIGWETTSQTNVGVDFGFFKNRLNGSVEFFSTKTNDLLVKRTISSSLGYSSITDNMGKTSTWGTEIALSGDIIRKKDLKWTIGSNFSMYRNKILKINGMKDENGKDVDDLVNHWFINQPLSVYYDYKFDGIYQMEDFDFKDGKYILKPTYDFDGDGVPETALQRDGYVAPGSIKVKDVNGDGKIDADDKVIIPKDPKFTMSLNTTLLWKGFDLYMDFYAVYGRIIKNDYLYDYNHGGSLSGSLNGVKVPYWTPDHPSKDYPRPNSAQGIAYHGTIGYQDASYFRLRTLTLGYTLPSSVLKKAKISKLRFYLTGTNLFTATKFLSYSPELTPGSYPEPREWVFGLNLSF